MKAERLLKISTKQLICVATIIVFVWFVLFQFLPQKNAKSSAQLKAEIIALSKQYIQTLSQEQRDLVDGPYSGRLTSYDLKKSMALLLNDLIQRVGSLEARMLNVSLLVSSCTNESDAIRRAHPPQAIKTISGEEEGGAASSLRDKGERGGAANARRALKNAVLDKIDAIDLLQGAQESCILSYEEKLNYPECDEKIVWMKKFWKSHACYKALGVDGSECSIIIYLSEIERFCPRLKFRIKSSPSSSEDHRRIHRFREDNSQLLRMLSPSAFPSSSSAATRGGVGGRGKKEHHSGLRFIRQRISRMWPDWMAAAHLTANQTLMRARSSKKVICYLGLLSTKANLHFDEHTFKGGPLGELVQWADLIASLYVLGHDLTITWELSDLLAVLKRIPGQNTPCQSDPTSVVQVLYTDIIGFNYFRNKINGRTCAIRIVDTFGTQPAYNHPEWIKKAGLKRTTWRGKKLMLNQFYTMYPHTPENSFLGYVVEQPDIPAEFFRKRNAKWQSGASRPIALVYGKNALMWLKAKPYLDILKEHFDIHATIAKESFPQKIKNIVPNYVINHGFLVGAAYMALVKQSTVFVGLGFPYEGPAPLEAIASGSIFLNPQFRPPHSLRNKKFFREKPTARELHSQHPYIEERIGPPYSYLIDISSRDNISDIVRRVLAHPLTRGFMPREFTAHGMLERLNMYLEKHDLCSRIWAFRPLRPLVNSLSDSSSSDSSSSGSEENSAFQPLLVDSKFNFDWPPLSSLRLFVGRLNESCSRTCQRMSRPTRTHTRTHTLKLHKKTEKEDEEEAVPRVCDINRVNALLNNRLALNARGVWCKHVTYRMGVGLPAFQPHTQTCVFQTEPLLYDCDSRAPDLMRFCACRDFLPGQTAVCRHCI